MENYPPNSQRARNAETAPQEPKKIERVVTGEVIRRKPPLSKRMFSTLVDGDRKSVIEYVIMDVIVPAAKDMVADAVSQGVERMIFGEARSRPRRGSGPPSGRNGYVSYNRIGGVTPNRRDEGRSISRRARASHDFDEIILDTRPEAEEVMDRLFDMVSQYGEATVKDLYELVGISPTYTDDKWGWTDLQGLKCERLRNGGYLLDLPRPEPLGQ